MKKRAKQLTALLLSAAMTLGMVTTSASATESSSSTGTSSSSTETTTSSATGMLGTSASVLDSFDEETLAVTAQAITDEETFTESSATEEEQAIKDEIYNDIFWNSDSVVDVSDYSTDVETMNELTDEVLEENNASTLVTVTYEEDELTGKATVMSVDMNPELEAVTEKVQAMADDETNPYAITDDQAEEILGLYTEYQTLCNKYVAYIGRQTAWYTSYEQNEDELGPLGSLLVLAGLSVDYLRNYANYETDDGQTVYNTVVTIIQMYTYAYEYGVEDYGSSIISAKNDALEAVEDAGCKTEAQEYMVLTDWMSNRITFDMAYIMNQSAEVMTCADPQTSDEYTKIYNELYEEYYSQYSAYVSARYMDETTAQGYAAQTAAGLTDGIYTVWESCTIGGLADELGSCVCLGYSMTFAYLVQWLHPEIYAANGTSLSTDSSSWKSVEELNYKTTTTTETVTTTETTWDQATYYALKAVEITVEKPALEYSEADGTVAFSCVTDGVTYWYSYTVDGEYTALDSGVTVLDVSDHIGTGDTLYAYAELNGTKSETNSVELIKTTEGGEEDGTGEGNGTGEGDATGGEGGTSSDQQPEEEPTVVAENTANGTLEATIGTTVTDYPLYVWDDSSSAYVLDTDDNGNALYVQNYDASNTELFTTEKTGYPVYITTTTSKDVTTTENTFSIDAGYIVDIVEIFYDASVSMFGEVNEDFQSQHFWSAVKIGDEWYYIDTNYIDIYTECMVRDRVETNGDLNFNYFLFSDTTANELYGDYMGEEGLVTLYDGIATDTSYEGGAWMYYSGSNIYVNGGNAYYVFDSTDLMSMSSMMSSGDFDMSSYTGDMSDYEDEEVEYKIVYHTLTTTDVTDTDTAPTDYTTLIDFNNGQIYNPSTKSMEDNDLIKELFALHQEYEEIYPSLSLTMALYDGVIYFNVANCVLSYNLSSGDLVKVKEYNEVYAERDDTVLFGGMGFKVVYDADEADVVVENPPIAGLVIYDKTLYVDVASSYGWISGKSDVSDTSSYGWEYAQSNYNAGYSSMMISYLDSMSESEKQQYAEYLDDMDTENDNDEFMFSANFTDTLSMSTVTSPSSYSEVSVAASCNNDAFTEQRSTEGIINDGTRVEQEGTACDHHYVEYDETYYTKDDNGNWNTGTSYVCTICGKAYDNSDAEDDDEEVVAEYEAAKASAGHDYVTDTSVEGYVTWADDYSYALINNLTCSVCGDMKQTVLRVSGDTNVETTVYSLDVLNDEIDELEISLSENEAIQCTNIVSEVTGGTCDTGLDVTYTAYGPADTKYGDFSTVVMDTTSTTLPAGTHSYVAEDADGNSTWVWTENEDGTYSAMVTELTCSECGDVQTNVEAVVTDETTAAKCTEDGQTVYTAKATVYDANGNETGSVTDYKTVVIPATGHDYDENGICKNGCGTSEISYGTMTLSEDTVLYTEEAQTPTVTLTMTSEEGTDVVLTEGTDYEVSYEDNVEIGTATVTVTGKGSYEGTQSKTFTISELTTPELTAISNTTSGVEITWSESENAKQYAVFRRKSGSTSWSGTQLALTDETSYTDTTASSGTNYEYTVRCIDSTGTNYTSEYDTNGVSIVYLTAGQVTSLANAKSGMTIKWDEVKGASGYYIYRKESGGSYKKIKTITDGSTTSYTEGSTKVGESGTKYTYCVKPYYKDGDTVVATGAHTAGKSKVRLSAGTITSLSKSSSGITIKWEEVEGATGYIIYRKTNKSGSTEYKKIKTITSGSTVSYKDTANKTTATKYTYKVVPYYQASSSSSKVNASFTAKSTYWVKATSISSLKNNSSKKMTLKWSKISKATGYQIQYSTSSDFSNAKTVWVKSGSTTSKTISSLTKGKKYYVRIRAYYKTSSGTKYYSTWSSKKSVKISK